VGNDHPWLLVQPRPRATAEVEIDAGRPVKPIITPDDPDRLLAALHSHDVTVPDRE
jgi:hypothetical protein